ncbi:hypothetical protein ACWEFL_33190 [Streptomyces sp. NPDC004838]
MFGHRETFFRQAYFCDGHLAPHQAKTFSAGTRTGERAMGASRIQRLGETFSYGFTADGMLPPVTV